MVTQNLKKIFEKQVENLIRNGYPHMLGLSESEFIINLKPLFEKIEVFSVPEINLIEGKLPFVIVVKSDLISPEHAMSLTIKDGKKGITLLRPHTSQNFRNIDSIIIPEGMAYLLVDIDRGKENINLPPNEAIKIIEGKGRSPLTIDEGISIITHFPEFLIKNNCFSLLGSRTGTDQRVPAIWINSQKEPNLGWCWDGNPHTWIGSASCIKRIGNDHIVF